MGNGYVRNEDKSPAITSLVTSLSFSIYVKEVLIVFDCTVFIINNNYMIWCCVHVIKVLCWVIYQCFNKALLAGNIFQKVKRRPSIKT